MKALQAAMGDQGATDSAAHTKMSPVEIRKAARELASKTIEEQKKNFREWAIMGDWDNVWQTMQKDFELKQLQVFQEMVEKGKVGSSPIDSTVNLKLMPHDRIDL